MLTGDAAPRGGRGAAALPLWPRACDPCGCNRPAPPIAPVRLPGSAPRRPVQGGPAQFPAAATAAGLPFDSSVGHGLGRGGGADDFWARCLCPPLFALCPADGGRGRGGEIPWTRAFAGRPPSPCRSFQSARNGGSAKPAGEWGVSALTAARRLPWAFVRTRNTCGTQPPARPVGTCDPPSAGTATPVARVADPQGRKGPPAERRSGGNGPVRRRLEQAKW